MLELRLTCEPLPVRIEMGRDGRGGRCLLVTGCDFEWDVPAEAAGFRLGIADGSIFRDY